MYQYIQINYWMTFLETWKVTSVRKIKAAILDDPWEIMITKACVNNHTSYSKQLAIFKDYIKDD